MSTTPGTPDTTAWGDVAPWDEPLPLDGLDAGPLDDDLEDALDDEVNAPPATLPVRVATDARDAVVDWTDPDTATTAAQATRVAVLSEVRALYAAARTARPDVGRRVVAATVAGELGFLHAAAHALTALSDAIRAGADEARTIAGDVVLEVEPDREHGTTSLKVGTSTGTVKVTRTQASEVSADLPAIVDVLVADLVAQLDGPTATATAAGIRAGIARVFELSSPPKLKTTALDAYGRDLAARGLDALAIRLGHAYGRVPKGEPRTTLERVADTPAKAAKA